MPVTRDLLEPLLRRRDLSEVQAEELLGHLTDPQSAPTMAGALCGSVR